MEALRAVAGCRERQSRLKTAKVTTLRSLPLAPLQELGPSRLTPWNTSPHVPMGAIAAPFRSQVVGVTCCSASLPVLEGHRFEVLVMDECSQMVEPLSMLPVLSSRCRSSPLVFPCWASVPYGTPSATK